MAIYSVLTVDPAALRPLIATLILSTLFSGGEIGPYPSGVTPTGKHKYMQDAGQSNCLKSYSILTGVCFSVLIILLTILELLWTVAGVYRESPSHPGLRR